MADEDCLSVNSDFERISNTPMEREADDYDDLDEGQKTPNGLAASESSMFVLLEFSKIGKKLWHFKRWVKFKIHFGAKYEKFLNKKLKIKFKVTPSLLHSCKR